MTLCWRAYPRGPILPAPLQIQVPGCKSITQRAALLAAVASGSSRIRAPLVAEDSLATLGAVRALGVQVQVERGQTGAAAWVIQGRPDLAAGGETPLRLEFGNSGTGMRLAAGLLCGRGLRLSLRGDASLSARPMERIAEPLRRMGARIDTSASGTAPLEIHPAGRLRGMEYELPVPSAQVKSAVLLAGLRAEGETAVVESWPLRDHTERMLRRMGAQVQVAESGGGRRISVQPAERLDALDCEVPGDPSAAIFPAVLALLAGEDNLHLPAVLHNPTRARFVDILAPAGLAWGQEAGRGEAWEPVRALDARRAGEAPPGFALQGDDTALCIDEIPALAVYAACCTGVTRIRDAAELRVKESDRLAALEEGLRRLGIEVTAHPDGLDIQGRGSEDRVFAGGATLDSHGDHRIAMAFAVAAARAEGPIEIRDVGPVATSYPAFAEHLGAMGLVLEEYEAK